MSRRSDASLAALLLTNRLVDVDAKPLTAKEFWPLCREIGDLARLLDGWTDDVSGVEADRIAGLVGASAAVAFELERLERSGLWVISGIDDDYPTRFVERLGDAAPPVLIGAGPTVLLDNGGLGVVGSRDVDEQGAQVARTAARAAAGRGWSLISGGARGVDQLSMHAAEEAGGAVVGFLAEGVHRRLQEVDVRRAISEDRACFCSPFKPDAGFRAGNAMGRNKLIYAAADVTLVVASDLDSGGTWAGATESLRRGFGPVAVWRGEGEGPGNAALTARGATGVDEVGDLFGTPPTVRPATDPETEQLQLGIA